VERRAGSAGTGASNVICCRPVGGRLNAALGSGSQERQKKAHYKAQEASTKRRSEKSSKYSVGQEHRKCDEAAQ
jgi:hypothetical protein